LLGLRDCLCHRCLLGFRLPVCGRPRIDWLITSEHIFCMSAFRCLQGDR
jgi:hypothetical protein